jgi:hypothetical protein
MPKQRGRKIGRPGKEDRAMDSPTLESKYTRILLLRFRYIRTAGLAGIVCGANIRPKLLVGGGSCNETET